MVSCRVPASPTHAANGAHASPPGCAPVECRGRLRAVENNESRGHHCDRPLGGLPAESVLRLEERPRSCPQHLSRTSLLARGARPWTLVPQLPPENWRCGVMQIPPSGTGAGCFSPAARRGACAPTLVASRRCRRPLLQPRCAQRSTRPGGPFPRLRCRFPSLEAASPRRGSMELKRAGARGRGRCRRRQVRGPVQLPCFEPRNQREARHPDCNNEAQALEWSLRLWEAEVAPATPPHAEAASSVWHVLGCQALPPTCDTQKSVARARSRPSTHNRNWRRGVLMHNNAPQQPARPLWTATCPCAACAPRP